MPHLIIMRVMMDRKTLHMIYAISYCYDDVIMYRNHICNDVISMNIVIDYVVSNILILSCCSIMHDLQNNRPLNFN